jgi:uncharacterized protein YxjI
MTQQKTDSENFTLQIDDPEDFTIENIKKLIASKDDSKTRQLRVAKAGLIYLSDFHMPPDDSIHALVYETWIRGADYCGKAASEDSHWVSEVYNWLQKDWKLWLNDRGDALYCDGSFDY